MKAIIVHNRSFSYDIDVKIIIVYYAYHRCGLIVRSAAVFFLTSHLSYNLTYSDTIYLWNIWQFQ